VLGSVLGEFLFPATWGGRGVAVQIMIARNPYFVRFIPFRQASFGLTILDEDKLYLISCQSGEKRDGKRSRRGNYHVEQSIEGGARGGDSPMHCWSQLQSPSFEAVSGAGRSAVPPRPPVLPTSRHRRGRVAAEDGSLFGRTGAV